MTKEALAQPEQEPVAWYRDEDGIRIYYETKCWDDAIPLYTAPQRTWVGLTDVLDFIEEFTGAERERHPMFSDGYDLALSHVKELVEAKLKEKNT